MTPRFPSGVGPGAMLARLESPRATYATPGFWIETIRAPRRRQLPTKQCHAALRFGATRAYQPDSSSKPPHHQRCAGVLGKLSTLTPPMLGRQHPPRDRRRRYKPRDSRSFHIRWRAVASRPPDDGAPPSCRRAGRRAALSDRPAIEAERPAGGQDVVRHSIFHDGHTLLDAETASETDHVLALSRNGDPPFSLIPSILYRESHSYRPPVKNCRLRSLEV